MKINQWLSEKPKHVALTPVDSGVSKSLQIQGDKGMFGEIRSFEKRSEKAKNQKRSVAGTRTRVSRVRAEYPNHLDYNGFDMKPQT